MGILNFEPKIYFFRCGSRIWSRGAQLLRPKVADIAKWSCMAAGVQGPSSFWVSMLKYALSDILETLFLSFLTSISIPKVEKKIEY